MTTENDGKPCPVCRTPMDVAVGLRTRRYIAVPTPSIPWEDADDEWSKAIDATTRAETYEEYATAMKMVGHRHSKDALVALVTWLLARLKRTKEGGGR